MTKAMKKIFVGVLGVGVFASVISAGAFGINPTKLTDAEIEELMVNIEVNISEKDIPALQNKVVVVDENWDIVLEQSIEVLEGKNGSSEERKLINRSDLLLEYAGNSYFLIEK